jgi:hypothetical protein
MAIKVGSAGKGQIGLGRRPKVLGRITVKYREVLARSTEVLARAIVESERWSKGEPLFDMAWAWIWNFSEKIKNKFTLLDENAQPRLDTHQNGRGIVERSVTRPRFRWNGRCGMSTSHMEPKIESIICNGRQKRPRPVKTVGRRPEKY